MPPIKLNMMEIEINRFCLVNISINRSVKVPFEPSYKDLEAHPLVEIDMPIDKYSYIMDD